MTWCYWSRGADLNHRPSGYEVATTLFHSDISTQIEVKKQRRDKYTWRHRHSLGKDPVTGKYRYSPWRTIHTTKSREVDAALEAYKAELNSGTYVQKSRDTVGSYAKKFHDNREGTITPLAYSTSYSIENRTRTSHA